MTDLIAKAQDACSKFYGEDFKPWVQKHPTAATALTATAIGVTVSICMAAGPVGLAFAAPLIILAVAISIVALRNFDTYKEMLDLEWTQSKNEPEFLSRFATLNGDAIEQETVKKALGNLPLIFVTSADERWKFRGPQVQAGESASNATTHASGGRLRRAVGAGVQAVKSVAGAVASTVQDAVGSDRAETETGQQMRMAWVSLLLPKLAKQMRGDDSE